MRAGPPASRWVRLPWSVVTDVGTALHLGVRAPRSTRPGPSAGSVTTSSRAYLEADMILGDLLDATVRDESGRLVGSTA